MEPTSFPRKLILFLFLAALVGFGFGALQYLSQNRSRTTGAWATATPFIPAADNPQDPGETTLPLFTPLAVNSISLVGQPAQDFTLPDQSGNDVSLSDFTGKVVLINFWASWCPPCRDEMPVLQSAYEQYREQGFEILAINTLYLDTRADADAFVEELDLHLPILFDEDGSVSENIFGVVGLPTSVWVDRQGNVHSYHIGPLTEEDIHSVLEQILPRN